MLLSRIYGPGTACSATTRWPNGLCRCDVTMNLVLVLAWSLTWGFSQSSPSLDARSSAKASYERGKQLLEEKRFQEAANEFRETLKFTADAPLLHNLLGYCHQQLGQTEQAIAEFKRAIALKPDYKAARNNLGGIYLLQGRPHDAIPEFAAVVKSDAQDLQALSNLARAEMAANRKEEAIEHLRAAYERSPASLPTSLALARLYLETGQLKLGRPIAGGLVKASTRDAASELELGKLLLDYELDDSAQDHFRKALKIDPGFQKILYAVATDYFKRQNYRGALKSLECLDPSTVNAGDWHGMRGYCRFKLGDSAEAAKELQRAIELDPHNQDHVLELAEVFVANNNANAAVTLMETATKVFVQSASVWFGLGVAYLGDEKLSSAEAALKRSLALDPALDLAYVVLGQSYKEAGNWGQLLEASQRLIQVNPRNSVGYYYKALALQASPTLKATDEAEVERLLRKSLELNNRAPESHYELAKLLLRQGKKDDSLQALEKIGQTWPDFGPAYYQLSRLYRERGEIEKSNEAQKAHNRIRQKERDTVMKRMIVEIQQRPKSRVAPEVQ
jgi:tetratricopeptide (TPR) repeat protein